MPSRRSLPFLFFLRRTNGSKLEKLFAVSGLKWLISSGFCDSNFLAVKRLQMCPGNLAKSDVHFAEAAPSTIHQRSAVLLGLPSLWQYLHGWSLMDFCDAPCDLCPCNTLKTPSVVWCHSISVCVVVCVRASFSCPAPDMVQGKTGCCALNTWSCPRGVRHSISSNMAQHVIGCARIILNNDIFLRCGSSAVRERRGNDLHKGAWLHDTVKLANSSRVE